MKKQLLYSVFTLILLAFSGNAQVGFTCETPLVITSLPFQAIDNTANYGNTLLGPQLGTCISISTNYQSGNDVFYSYTAVEDAVVSFILSPTETRSSLFIYPSCSGITGNCLAAVANTTNSPRVINYNVVAGANYTVVISSNSISPTIHYNLLIQKENCAKPINLTVSNSTLNSATFSWNTTQENVLSHQVAVQPQGSLVPSGSGQYSGITTSTFTPTDLTAGTLYEYWVRSECSPGVYSAWAGPVLFSTQICTPTDQCAYTFRMTDSANNGWNGARMQVRQNGIVVATIGSTYNAGAGPVDVTVPLCNGVPFDVFWEVAGSQPQQCILSIVNSFGQTIQIINGATATVGTTLYNGIINCDTVVCYLIPMNVAVIPATTGGTINWEAPGTENMGFDVYVLPAGSPEPSNVMSPTYSGVNGPAAPFSYTIPSILLPDTSYDVYVRVQCQPNIPPCSVGVTFTTLPTCPKPSNLTAIATATSAELSWTEIGSATQWEVYVAEEGMPEPVNGTPLNGGNASYYFATTNTNFAVNGLTSSTNYTYYVRAVCSSNDIGNWTILNPQAFTTKPSNDDCSTAIAIPVNPTPEMVQTVTGSTLGGTPSAEISTCSGNPNDDVWFSFVATNSSHIIELNNIIDATTSIRFAVYNGTDCASLTQIFCNATNSTLGVLSSLIVGEVYKIRVYTNIINLNLSVKFDIGIKTPLPITNDECSGAIPLNINPGLECIQTMSGSIIGATASANPSGCSGSEDDDVWFSFVATKTRHYISLTDIVGTATDLNSSVYLGDDCGNLTFISCNTNDHSVMYGLVPGTMYKIRVWSASSSAQDVQFNICIGNIPDPLTVTTNQYTVPQLVNDILINSACSTIANISWSTGTSTTTNGIGYFNKGNSEFPFDQGIVLSTGNVNSVPGPNNSILSGGGATGDADLSAILAAQTPPVTGTLNNATKLEFDFVAVTNQINFNFLFASEEYGVYQCGCSDAFAFILTDLTAATPPTNIAVLPGTNVPVSIFNIRDNQYNVACPSSNLAYFGNYYNNTQGIIGAPIDFNGITVPMTAGATVIPGNSYHIKMVIADYNDTAYDSAVFLQGGSFNPGDNGCTDKIKLIAFNDTNNNGIKEETETSFTYGAFQYQLNDTGDIHNLSSPIGVYTIFDENPVNSYDFTYNVHPEYAIYFSAGTTTHSNITILAGSGTQTLYFPISQLQGYNDVNVSISPIGQPRPGFTHNSKVVYTNLGTAPTSGTITYTKDPAVSIGSSQSGVNFTPTGFTYDFVNLAPSETRNLNISLTVPPIPTVNLDDILTSAVQITAPANDINVNNNSFSMLQVVVASYDPNDKMEAHGAKLDINTFNQEDYLYYTIRFQNTGTTNAIDIRIEDMLDAQLDEASMRMVSSSHNYLLERVGNKLVWKFPGINLPSVIQDEALSQGYVTFRIKIMPGFAVGDIIPNFAEIYFDTNPPIITNTFLSEFGVNLSAQTFTANTVILYPNPTHSILNVNVQGTSESIAKITIYDIIGKSIKTISGTNSQQMSINVSDLSTGVYMIEIITDTNMKQIKKFIVN